MRKGDGGKPARAYGCPLPFRIRGAKRHMKKNIYAFDLDGTVTETEILPVLAQEIGLMREMKLLTELTLRGVIDFQDSFRLRFHILKSIPLREVQDVVGGLGLNQQIAAFIRSHKEECAVVTGNLDVWIQPIAEQLGCRFYTSESDRGEKGLHLRSIMDKGRVIRELKKEGANVIVIGESFNDIPMFEEADVKIAYGGVHHPVSQIIAISNYVTYDGGSLCRLLNAL